MSISFRWFIIACVILILLQVLDTVTTLICLSQGAREINPLFAMMGLTGFLIVKATVSIFCLATFVGCYVYLSKNEPRYTWLVWFAVVVVTILYTGAVISNTANIIFPFFSVWGENSIKALF